MRAVVVLLIVAVVAMAVVAVLAQRNRRAGSVQAGRRGAVRSMAGRR